MTDIVLAIGQVWKPTKGRSKARKILRVFGYIKLTVEWQYVGSKTTGPYAEENQFRAWIARTGAMLETKQ